MKSITSHYRHTNKQAPTKPSYFIPNVFKPFHQLRKENAKWTNASTEHEWAQEVAKPIITEYASIVNDLLSSTTITEKNKKPASSKEEMTDEQKIRLQLYLDVKQLGQEVIFINVDTPDHTNNYWHIVGSTKDRPH